MKSHWACNLPQVNLEILFSVGSSMQASKATRSFELKFKQQFVFKVPLLRVIVLLPSVALKSPLHVASPLCATLNSMPSNASDATDAFSYTKHLNRSSFDVAWLWCTLPTRYRELPSFHTAKHCNSSTESE